MHRLTILAVMGWAMSAVGCSREPLLVSGEFQVQDGPDRMLSLDFPRVTTLVRSPRATDGNVAGECTVERDFFSVTISRDEDTDGLRSVSVSSDEASVDIGGVVYSGLEGATCFIDALSADPGSGQVTFVVECLLDDGDGNTVSAQGELSLEGCN